MSELFGHGALPDPVDHRDIAFSAVAPFDYELGFDIELLLGYRVFCGDNIAKFWGGGGRTAWGVLRYKEIVDIVRRDGVPHFRIPVKNQGQSSSCTGQALSYYISVLNMLETGKWVDISARDIYAYISLGAHVGANLRDALKLAVDRGAATEELVPSYKENKVPKSEDDFLVKPEETEAILAIRAALSAKEYRLVSVTDSSRMDQMAWAALQGFGCYFGLTGTNNGTWMTLWPKPPAVAAALWGHALYAGKVGIKDGKKFIGDLNSWGEGCGNKGWQCLGEDYINGELYTDGTKTNKQNFLFNPWTLVDKPNAPEPTMSVVKIIKDKNSAAVGFWLPALSEAALDSLAFNFGITLPKKEDGTMDWDKAIEGELELK